MKPNNTVIITLVIATICTCALKSSAIFVPTAWPSTTDSTPPLVELENRRRSQGEFRPPRIVYHSRRRPSQGSEIYVHGKSSPYGDPPPRPKQNTRHHSPLKKIYHNNDNDNGYYNPKHQKHAAVKQVPLKVKIDTSNDWIPVVYPKPHHSAYYAYNRNEQPGYHQGFSGGPESGQFDGLLTSTPKPYFEEVVQKNYRDDKTHEPQEHDEERLIENRDEPRNEERETEHEEHESDEDKTENEQQSDKDVKAHTPEEQEEEAEEEANSAEEEQEGDEEEASSPHENPPEVPTRPIYPGPGKWAQRGVKHYPHISPHRFGPPNHDYFDLKEEQHADDEKPEGFEVFAKNRHIFDHHKDDFEYKFSDFPTRHDLGSYATSPQHNSFGAKFSSQPTQKHGPETESYTPASPSTHLDDHHVEGADEQTEDDTHEFVPTRLYSQVRRSENEEHLPRLPEDERLREVVKDSKIQTVYTEEGYEDIAYDHAGEEKNAEESEGFREFDKEIAKQKAKDLEEDADESQQQGDNIAADSQYQDFDTNNETNNDFLKTKDTKKIHLGSKNPAVTKDKSNKMKMNKKNLMQTKQTKTTEVKDAKDGDKELEISSEIKVIVTPENATEAHKFVKIFPKTHHVIKAVKKPIVKNSSFKMDRNSSETAAKTDHIPKIDGTEISNKKQPGSIEANVTNLLVFESIKLPVVEPTPIDTKTVHKTPEQLESAMSEIEKSFHNIQQKRTKRFAIDYPKIEIDTKFIDNIKHPQLPVAPTEDPRKYKYPYYNDPRLNPDSPLRYAEDLSGIPDKQGDDLAFYNQANSRVECQEVESDVDPIPDRVKNADKNAEQMEETTDVQELAQSPRLRGLGDKIDCFKRKYFGEEPLDSPFFDERTIGPVVPLFAPLKPQFNQGKIGLLQEQARNQDRILKQHQKNQADLIQKQSANSARILKEQQLNQANLIQEPTANLERQRLNQATLIQKQSENAARISEQQQLDQSNLIQKHSELRQSSVWNRTRARESTSTPRTLFRHHQFGLKIVPKKAQTNSSDDLKFNILKDVVKQFSNSTPPVETTTIKINATVVEEPARVEEVKKPSENDTEIATVLIITTPKYTIDLTPKHIYDQIELLQHLPNQKVEVRQNNTEQQKNENKIDEEVVPNKTISTESRQGKSLEDTATKPESEALVLHKRRRRVRPKQPMMYHIFDINRFLPTHPKLFLDRTLSPPVPEVDKKISEAIQYQNDIRANEQLNVLSDVINNIKNSSKNVEQVQSVVNPVQPNEYHQQNSNPVSVSHGIDLPMTTTTIKPIVATSKQTKKHTSHKSNDQLYDNLRYDRIELYKINAKLPSTKKNSYLISNSGTTYIGSTANKATTPLVPSGVQISAKLPTATKIDTSENLYADNIPASAAGDEATVPTLQPIVIGLMPPVPIRYKTIHVPQAEPLPKIVLPLNNFYVYGMKPPSAQQKITSYSEFKLGARPKVVVHRRYRRAASRSDYAPVVRNRNKPIDVQDDEEVIDVNKEDDEYVPHRPKNYHYDEKTGRIVYDNLKKDESVEQDEEVVEIEVTDAPIPKPSSKSGGTKALGFLERFNVKSEGPSFVEFVKKLKTSNQYVSIPDPTTTEKGSVMEAEAAGSTTVAVSTASAKPPEFLSILAKARSDPNYKPLEDKKKTSSTTSTTTEAEDVEEEEEAESTAQQENVQNSPGGSSQNLGIGQGFQIFDISDYLPKVKTYTPRTSVDYSKYKNIERPTTRHNLSSRYNSKEESLDEVKTVRVPVLLEDKSDRLEIEPMMSGSTHEDIEPSPASTTTEKIEPTTSKASIQRIRTRVRGRGTRRPAHSTTEQSSTQGTQSTQNLVVEESPTSTAPPPVHDKVKRVYRRRPVRIRTGSIQTTEHSLNPEAQDTEDTTKILRRRHQEADTSQPVGETQRISETHIKRRRARMRNFEENDQKLSANNTSDVSKTPETHGKIEARSIDGRVEVFQRYDPNKKHGGNYRREEAAKKEQQDEKDKESTGKEDSSSADGAKEESLTTEVTKPTDGFYTDPKLPSKVNQLTEPNLTIVEEETEESNDNRNEDTEDQTEEDFDGITEDSDDEEAGAPRENKQDDKKLATTKKPNFIKDPSKRMYYYAPI